MQSTKVGTQHLVDEAELHALADEVAALDLPQAWRAADDGTPLPDWERLLRESRVRR